MLNKAKKTPLDLACEFGRAKVSHLISVGTYQYLISSVFMIILHVGCHLLHHCKYGPCDLIDYVICCASESHTI